MGKETIFDDDLLTVVQIAESMGVLKRNISRRLKSENALFDESRLNGGITKLFALKDLPQDLKDAVIAKYGNTEKPARSDDVQAMVDKELETMPEPLILTVDHGNFDRKPLEQKTEAIRKAKICGEYQKLVLEGTSSQKAMELVARQHDGMSWRTIQNWWHGKKGKPGVKHFDRKDWAAALVNSFTGRKKSTDFTQLAFDYYSALFLNRRKPSYADCFRRTEEACIKESWVMASEKTYERHVKELSRQTVILYREGEEAMRQAFPFQHRDKTCFKAGEAVTGDGLKFDKVWVEFPDGEILNTCTGWIWQDIYSGKIVAWRLAKTENTDVFRLATYDLLGVATPDYMQIDNTRAAANKVMTAHIAGRHRFKDLPTDAPGILYYLGIDAHFTNPDHKISNPGVKPIERSFGIGGIHEKVSWNPALRERGFSKKTAVPFEEFKAIVESEINSHNAQKKRRSDVCQVIYSFDEAFQKSFATAAPRKSTEQQRTLLLMLQEQVKCANNNGIGNGILGA